MDNNSTTSEQQILQEAEQIATDAQQSDMNLWSMNDILSANFPQEEWLIERLLPFSGVTITAGSPSSGKTWLVLEMGKSVATGQPFLNKFKTKQGAVLFISEEDYVGHLKKRFLQLGFESNMHFYSLIEQGFRIDSDKWMENIQTIIKENDIKLLILDSLRATHGKRESDSGDMNEVFSRLKNLNKLGITILTTHHNRKGGGDSESPEDMRGSSDILAKIDCLLGMRKTGNEIVVMQHKIKIDEQIGGFLVQMNIDKEANTVRFEYKGAKGEKVTEAIMNTLSDGEMDLQQIIDAVRKQDENIAPSAIGNKLRQLKNQGWIIAKSQGKTNKMLYSLNQEI